MIPIAYPDLSDAAIDHVGDVMESGMIADGPTVRDFESEFAEFAGTDHAVATANGTAALQAALIAAGIGEGDTVLTTPFSFIASANAARLCGAEVVFADIDPETYNLDPEAVRKRVESVDVDAIVAVHLYGLPAEMDALTAIASEEDAVLVEDAAQAHGAVFSGDRVGAIGDVGCFSFYPTKNMTTAEGGMVTTDDPEIAKRARRFVNHGRTSGYQHATVGHNLRMTSVGAAIGLEQLKRLPSFNEQRRHNAAKLTAGIAKTSIEAPTEPPRTRHVYHQYTVRTADRDELQSYLEDNCVGTGIYYPKCIHEQPAYSTVSRQLPVAESTADTVLSLPVHPHVSETDLDHIIDILQNYDNQ